MGADCTILKLCLLLLVLLSNMVATSDDNPRVTASLNGEWQFRLDPLRQGETETWHNESTDFPDRIKVPGNWQAQGFGPAIRRLRHDYQGIAWYRRHFELPAQATGKRVWLRLQSVCNHGEVFVNGRPVGRIPTFITPYEFEITDILRPGTNNTVVLKVDSGSTPEMSRTNMALGDPSSANGYVGMIQYWAKWGGIIGNVDLLIRADVYLHDVVVRSDIAHNCVEVTCEAQRRISNTPWKGKAVVTVSPERPGVEQATSKDIPVVFGAGNTNTGPLLVNIVLPKMHLWSPEDPYLYNVTIRLLLDGETVDFINERTGMREFDVGGGNGAFILNRRPYFLRGLGYDSIEPITGTPLPDKRIYLERFTRVRQLGFNCVRLLAHTPYREFFDAADEAGLLVQAEGEWFLGATAAMRMDISRLLSEQVSRIIREHRNHPSWYAFSCLNEGGFVDSADAEAKMSYVHHAHRAFKTLDPTRYFLASDGGDDWWPTDIINPRPPVQRFYGDIADFAYFRRSLDDGAMAQLAASSPTGDSSPFHLLKPDGSWRKAGFPQAESLALAAPSLLVGGNGSFSASTWVKPAGFGVGNFGTLFSFGAPFPGQALLIALDGERGDGQLLVGRYGHNVLESKARLAAAAWNHVGVTYDGAAIHLFINGNPDADCKARLEIQPYDLELGKLISRRARPLQDYRTRPGVWHEFNQTYIGPLPDLDKEAKLANGILRQEPGLLDRHRSRIVSLGLRERYPALRRASVQSYYNYVKQAFEGARIDPDLDGFHWWVISDIPAGFECDVTDYGLLNITYQPDKFPDPARFRTFNATSVLLLDSTASGFVLASGTPRTTRIYFSHFGQEPVRNGRLTWRIAINNQTESEGVVEDVYAAPGRVTHIGTIQLGPFSTSIAQAAEFSVRLESAFKDSPENSWTFWIFPARKPGTPVHKVVNSTSVVEVGERYPGSSGRTAEAGCLVLADTLNSNLVAFVEAGGAVILLERNPALSSRTWPEVMSPDVRPMENASGILNHSIPLPFWPRWIRCNVNVIEDHPALSDFPHGQFADLQLARLYGVTVNAADLSDPIVRRKLQPIVWGLNLEDADSLTADFPHPQEFFQGAAISEARLGQGRLIHCGLWLADGIGSGLPEAGYLLDCLVSYLIGTPQPPNQARLTREEAHRVFSVR